jgi:hypothetical protein
MSQQTPSADIELEVIQQGLDALLEAEQTSLLRALSLPDGYGKSQAIAEYSNVMSAASGTRLWRDLLIATRGVRRRITRERG